MEDHNLTYKENFHAENIARAMSSSCTTPACKSQSTIFLCGCLSITAALERFRTGATRENAQSLDDHRLPCKNCDNSSPVPWQIICIGQNGVCCTQSGSN